MSLLLYYSPGTAALAVHILLEELGVSHRLERVDFASGAQHGAAFRAVNPKGRVPALSTSDGILTETPAILAYLCQTHPQAGLAPQDPFAFAQAQAFNVYLASTVHVAHAHRPRAERWSDDPATYPAMHAKVPQNMNECMRYISDRYLDGEWVLGAKYSMCDAYLFTVARWLEGDGVALSDHPKIAAHLTAVQSRPAVQRALEHHLPKP
ncbi:MAG: glutathione S-transferase family protein [Pseudomonadota bacterium]